MDKIEIKFTFTEPGHENCHENNDSLKRIELDIRFENKLEICDVAVLRAISMSNIKCARNARNMAMGEGGGGNVSAMNSVYPASHAQVTLTN